MTLTCHLAPAFLGVFARYAMQKHPKSPAQVATRYGLLQDKQQCTNNLINEAMQKLFYQRITRTKISRFVKFQKLNQNRTIIDR